MLEWFPGLWQVINPTATSEETMNKTHEYRFQESAEQVAAVMANPEFHLAFDKTRDDIAGTEMRLGQEQGGIIPFTMLTQEYKRTLTGGIDRSASTEGRTDFRWNPASKVLDWQYSSGVDPKRIRILGRYSIRSEGSACVLAHNYTIEVKIPLIGGKVEKKIGEGFDKSFPKFERMVREHLAG